MATGRDVERKQGTRCLMCGLASHANGIPARPPPQPGELELIRRQIEEGFEVIGAVDDEIRGIVARNWPHLLSKLPPEEE